MVRSVAGNLPEQVKNNQSVNTAAGNGGQKMSQYSWFTVYLSYDAPPFLHFHYMCKWESAQMWNLVKKQRPVLKTERC